MVKATTTKAGADPDDALKRLGGGRWSTRDGRFTIEPQSGTWVVIDAEQTDELGLPLVRGPFASLNAAKAAISAARASLPAASPLEARAVAIRTRAAEPPRVGKAAGRRARAATSAVTSTRASHTPPAPSEPRWIAELAPTDRRRARQLIERLTAAGASDAEAIARRDIVGAVPAAAAFAISRAILDLGSSATPSTVAHLLAEGRDEDLGLRWRLVDGDGRVITLELGPEASKG